MNPEYFTKVSSVCLFWTIIHDWSQLTFAMSGDLYSFGEYICPCYMKVMFVQPQPGPLYTDFRKR